MTKRRDFLKNAGLGSLGVLLPFSGESKSLETTIENTRSESTKLGKDVELDFKFKGEEFLGLGGVKINGISMRNAERPMFVDIQSPDAIQLEDFKVIERKISESEIRFKFSAKQKLGGTMDWMIHTVRNRQNLADWTESIKNADDTTLELVILPVSRKIGKHNFKGFSYQYFYKSASIPIYKILDRGSWEINGSAMGNHFWMRNGIVDALTEFTSPDQFYSTEWYLPNIANPNIFQYNPLQTQLQGFTFTSSNKGTLVTWPTEVSHVRSLFEKWRHKNDIIHYHEHCNDLGLELKTSPMEVLWNSSAPTTVSRMNLFEAMREHVHEELHRQIGMRRERITTYGVIEEWTEPDFDYYREKGLSKLIDVGVKTVFIPSQCENAMNTWGLSNMCCNVDFKISETVGEDKLKLFCQTAQKAGVKIEMWGNTALSTMTELFSHPDGKEKRIQFLPYKDSIMEVIDKAESPWIRTPSNAFEMDHYSPRFCALNLRDKDIRAYWMKQWKYFHDALGIEGIFLDSSFNMSSDKFHFRQWADGKGWYGATMDQKDALGKFRPEHEPAKLIHTMYHAHLEWVVEMQKMGYQYCGEDMGVFGINRTGPDVVDRANSLFIWQDAYCDFNANTLRKAGYEPFDVFFKGLAYRTMWKVYWDIKKDTLNIGIDDVRAFELIKIFNEVSVDMYNREILEDEVGVVYTKGDKMLLWSFNTFKYPLPKSSKVKELFSGKRYSAKIILAKKNEVYRIG